MMTRTALVLTGLLFVLTACGPRSDEPAPVEAQAAADAPAAESADSQESKGSEWPFSPP